MTRASDTNQTENPQPDIPNEIEKTWSIIPVRADSPISLRALPPKGCIRGLKPVNQTFTPSDYPSVEARKRAFEHEARRVNDLGYNVYVVLNAIGPDFGGKRNTGAAVRDVDIVRRTGILFDFDRTGSTDAPATPDELRAAMLVAGAVASYLRHIGWPKPVRGFSGNGFHLYWWLDDLPNDPETRDLIRSVLRALAQRFDTADVQIDQAVFNASRITKVPGTIARKGIESAGREYRMAQILDEAPTSLVTRKDLDRVIADLGIPDIADTRKNAARVAPRHPEPDTPLRRARLLDALRYVSADSERNDWRDIVWAILSTSWPDARAIAEAWCKTAPHRFTQDGFESILRSYDPASPHGHTLGTVFYIAKKGGWDG